MYKKMAFHERFAAKVCGGKLAKMLIGRVLSAGY